MPEPIAVAFVEVRPDTAGFKGQTETEVKQALASTDEVTASVAKIKQTDLSGTFAPFAAGAAAATQEVDALAAAVSSVPASVGNQAGLASAGAELAAVTAQATDLTAASTKAVASLADIGAEGGVVAGGLRSVSSQFDDLLARVRASQAEAAEFLATSKSAGGELETSVRGIGQTDLGSTFVPLEAGAKTAVAEVGALEAEVGALAAAVSAVPATIGGIGGLDTAGAEIANVAAQAKLLTGATEGTAAGLASVGTEGVQTATGLRSVSSQFDDLLARVRASQAEAKEFLATSRAVTDGATGEAAAIRSTAGAQTELNRVRAAQPKGGILPGGSSLLPLAGILVAVQALGQLSAALRVSGNEAGTTEGRFRNFGASLLSGDLVGAFQSLRSVSHDFSLEELRLIQQNPEVAKGLDEIGFSASIAKSQLAALEQLAKVPPAAAARVAEAAFSGSQPDQLSALREEAQRLKEQTAEARIVGAGSEGLNAVLADLFNKRAAIRAQIQSITQKQQESLLAGLTEAVTDATLNRDVVGVERALLNEKAALIGILIPFAASADERRKFKNELIGIDKRLEQEQQEIADEIKRHHDAMVQAAIAPAEGLITDATLTGSLQAELAAARSKADLLKLLIAVETDAKTREDLKNQLIAANQQVETIQGQITAEQERHAAALKAERERQDRALLDSLGLAEQRLQTAAFLAVQTTTIADDRRVLRSQIAFFREQAKNLALTVAERAGFAQKLVQAEGELKRVNREAVRAQIDTRESALQDAVTLAGFTEKNLADDKAALRKLIAFEKEQAHNMKLTVEERRKHLIAQRQAEKDLRDLKPSDGASFQRLAFEFLKTQQGFASTLAGNLLPAASAGGAIAGILSPGGASSGGGGGIIDFGGGPAGVPSPFAPPASSPAASLRESGGTGVSSGQVATLIHLQRETLRAIREGNRSNAHPEAVHSRRVQAASMETGW